MSHGKGMHADERFIIRIKHRSFSRYAVDWVWPIQHNDCGAASLARAHAEIERPNKGVVTRPDVLKINQQNIQALQHFGRRFAMFGVKTVDRDVQTRMLVTFTLHHVVLRLAEKAVLRAKQGRQLEQITGVSLENS